MQFYLAKNNKLRYKCEECKKMCFKAKNESVKNYPGLYQLGRANLINLFCYKEKVFIPMNTWRAEENLM